MSKKALTTVEGKNGSSSKDPAPMKDTTESKKIEFKVPTKVVKRDGRIENFEASRIEVAITRCFKGLNRTNFDAQKITKQIVNIVSAKFEQPTVEQVQDIVEMVLQAAGEYEAAKSYILYRAEHAKMRETRPVPDEVRDAFEASDKYFPSEIQKFQFYDKYARFTYEHGRRETWVETVDRAIDYLKELSDYRLQPLTYQRLRHAILNMKIMPSMRLLAMAGPAARRNNMSIYNCSYMPVDSVDSFVEAMIISMSGCGVGYSVEAEYIEKLPRIRRQKKDQQPMKALQKPWLCSGEDNVYCGNCGNVCEQKLVDMGLGPYEFQGRVGFDSNKQWVSSCCEEA